jgi:hypothetical protein
MEEQAGLRACVGCGAMVPDLEGPTHRYIGASPQAIRSVAVHLVALHLQLERETPIEGLYAARQRVASLGKEGRLNLGWLEPPASMGEVTVLRALEARDPDEYGEVARLWAESVWGAWSAHHETVRLWAAR